MNRKTEPVPLCPICNANGEIKINAKDYITKMDGTWVFRRCNNCHSLWQDPCTSQEDISKLYPENYSYNRKKNKENRLEAESISASLKLSILAHQFGYDLQASQVFCLAYVRAPVAPFDGCPIGRTDVSWMLDAVAEHLFAK